MSAVGSSQTVFTYVHDYNAFVAALTNGERCEIDEAMFVHWLEAAPPVGMRRDVVLADRREVRADFVSKSGNSDTSLQAFWQFCENENPADRRFFAQRVVCLV
jgi:hypothetical protein